MQLIVWVKMYNASVSLKKWLASKNRLYNPMKIQWINITTISRIFQILTEIFAILVERTSVDSSALKSSVNQ